MPSTTQVLRARAFRAQNGRCFYCGVFMWLASPAELPCDDRLKLKPSLAAAALLQLDTPQSQAPTGTRGIPGRGEAEGQARCLAPPVGV